MLHERKKKKGKLKFHDYFLPIKNSTFNLPDFSILFIKRYFSTFYNFYFYHIINHNVFPISYFIFQIYQYSRRILIRVKQKFLKLAKNFNNSQFFDKAIFVRKREKTLTSALRSHYETVSKFRFGLSWSGRRWRAMQPATDIGGNGNSIWIGGTPVTSQVHEQQQFGQLRPERRDDRSGSGGWAANGTAERTHLRDGAGSWRKTMIIKLIPIGQFDRLLPRRAKFFLSLPWWAENVTRFYETKRFYL